MQIIKLEEAKKYCDKHNVKRNDWVGGAIEGLLAGAHVIQYRHDGRYLATIDLEYIHSHMQSLTGFDEAFDLFMTLEDSDGLRSLRHEQAMLTIGELAEDFEIGIA